MRRHRQLSSLGDLLSFSSCSGKNTLPISQLRLTPSTPNQTTGHILLKPPLPNRHTRIHNHLRIPRQLRQMLQIHQLANMQILLLLNSGQRRSQCFLILPNLDLLFRLVFLVDFMPVQRISGNVVLFFPIRDVASDESLPELCIFAADLGGIGFDDYELRWGFDRF